MTDFLFRDDSYIRTAEARIIRRDGGVELDRTIFYASSGGQPGDTGTIRLENGRELRVSDTIHPDGDKNRILHLVEDLASLPAIGAAVSLAIDWDRRLRLMRMHTALHLLSVVLPYAVTGGSIGQDKGRLDFDMPEAPADLAAIESALNGLVIADHAVSAEWIAEADLRPELVKTMKVKPPIGQGRVRLIRIGDVDLQPCGGTHVRSTSEIGPLKLGKIEKKGRENRRVSIVFA